jgi:methylated-DNA-[protein]-cysteine S-methyltransferase
MTSYTTLKTSPLGDLLLVANETSLTGIYFNQHKHGPELQGDWVHDPTHPVLVQAAKELDEYLAGRRTTFSVPLGPNGTEFQQRVWKEIARVPFGKTITYSELARRAGSPQAIRAAGAATGRNPISIIVPCHRIVGKGGALTGYAGNLDRKKHLLGIEMKA